MGNRQQIESELKEINSILVELGSINPMTVPAGYFDTLPIIIYEKIQAENQLLMDNKHPDVYKVPTDYFERLPVDILAIIKEREHSENKIDIRNELEEVAPLLNTITKAAIYSVPDGYFNQIDIISLVTKEKVDAKIIPIRLVKKWMAYAAAAVVTCILITGAFLFTDNKNYQEYEKYNQLDFSSALTKVNDEELVTYLNSPEHIQNIHAETLLIDGQEAADIENTTILLVSDDELAHYLSENGELNKVTTPSKK